MQYLSKRNKYLNIKNIPDYNFIIEIGVVILKVYGIIKTEYLCKKLQYGKTYFIGIFIEKNNHIIFIRQEGI